MTRRIYWVRIIVGLAITSCLAAWTVLSQAQPVVPLSQETEACIACHETVTPGIVFDWRSSRHAQVTPAIAVAKPELERRMSATSVPQALHGAAVGCYECHSLRSSAHKDNFEHNGYSINVIVSPEDCRTCHAVEVEQFAGTKKAHALDNLQKNPVYHALVETVTGLSSVKGEKVVQGASSSTAKGETCYGCHGTRVEVNGTKTLSTESGDVVVPNLTNWPNQGVGRINPDGSQGACTACHPRHSFSIEVARKPYTCGQCHLEPDLPAYNVYRESKHGNIFDSQKERWSWDHVPWTPGKDFTAPTCATCHNSLLVSPGGEVIAQRSHNFADRLWVRIFGLIYSHPQPRTGKTFEIKNSDGLPLPTTFSGKTASTYLLNPEEQAARKGTMKKVCTACHGSSWADGHFAKLDTTVRETDAMVLAATKLVQSAWDAKLADGANPFDESPEHRWILQWLFYANSVRYASAMSGPDYAAFKNGWWELNKNIRDMEDLARLKKTTTR